MTMVYAIVLAALAYYAWYDALRPNFTLAVRPLISGFFTGIIIGDVQMGLLIGGTLELMALGVYILRRRDHPGILRRAILGTYFRSSIGFEVGIALAIPAALLLSNLDVLNRFLNFIFVHRADTYESQGNSKGFDRMMVVFSHIIWGFAPAIPVFLAIAFGEPAVRALNSFFEASPRINKGKATAGGSHRRLALPCCSRSCLFRNTRPSCC